jgi:hypothetical protein
LSHVGKSETYFGQNGAITSLCEHTKTKGRKKKGNTELRRVVRSDSVVCDAEGVSE